jgi:hypothetical protein
MVAFVFTAVALAGCCASGTGCPVTLPPELAASDGLVSSRDDGMQRDEPSMDRKAAVMIDPGMEPRRRRNADRSYEEQMADDRATDSELSRRLKICNGCGPSSGRDAMATNGMGGDAMGGDGAMAAPRAGRMAARPKNGEKSGGKGDDMSGTVQ